MEWNVEAAAQRENKALKFGLKMAGPETCACANVLQQESRCRPEKEISAVREGRLFQRRKDSVVAVLDARMRDKKASITDR